MKRQIRKQTFLVESETFSGFTVIVKERSLYRLSGGKCNLNIFCCSNSLDSMSTRLFCGKQTVCKLISRFEWKSKTITSGGEKVSEKFVEKMFEKKFF